jgi:hypothetical protein
MQNQDLSSRLECTLHTREWVYVASTRKNFQMLSSYSSLLFISYSSFSRLMIQLYCSKSFRAEYLAMCELIYEFRFWHEKNTVPTSKQILVAEVGQIVIIFNSVLTLHMFE